MKAKTIVPIALLAGLVALPVLAAEDGTALYNSKCAGCHGADGVAKKMAAGSRNFNDAAFKKEATVEMISKDVKEGKGKMKGMGDKLSADQVAAIANHVLTLK